MIAYKSHFLPLACWMNQGKKCFPSLSGVSSCPPSLLPFSVLTACSRVQTVSDRLVRSLAQWGCNITSARTSCH